MSNKPILAVFGATGAQGGGVVRAALADPKSPFTVRAIARNVQSDKVDVCDRIESCSQPAVRGSNRKITDVHRMRISNHVVIGRRISESIDHAND